MNVETAVAEYLEQEIGSLVYGDAADSPNVFVGELPTTPDEVVAVVGTGGPEADTRHGYDTAAVQVVARGTPHDRTSGYAVADSIYGALHGLTSTTFPDGTRVILVRGIQSRPVNIGPDDNARPRWSLNFELEVRNPTTNRE